MDEMEYRTTIMVIKTACGRKGFKNFMKNGVNKAKGVIVKALTEKPLGLSYLELNNRVAAFFSNERWEAAVWKMDSFVVALAGLEWEDKKIKVERGIYTLLVDNGKEDKSTKGYKHIVREDIPCWYELSWLKEKTSIILRIHKDFIKTARVIPQDAPIVKDFMESFKFSKFASDLNGDFGFDNAFVFKGVNGDFVEFSVPVPKVKKATGEKCHRCKGTGRDTVMEELGDKRKCDFCDGTGEKYFLDWRAAFAVSASFNIFFSLARYPESETSSLVPQLMVIYVVTNNDMHGGSLGGEFSIPFCEWLKSFEEGTHFPDVLEAMQATEKKMFGKERYLNFGFKAYMLRKGGVVLDVPGNACGIYNPPEHDYGLPRKEGCKFECHNVDSPMQQLTLLVGLAMLHDKARKEIKNY